MGALTGNTVQSTYLDLVQLGKSGAGLPAHAGKEAALYDGSGAQILGRTAIYNQHDPVPAASTFTETWEFSTKGEMTEVALAAAGWTFNADAAAKVTKGYLRLKNGGSAIRTYGQIACSLSGDFQLSVAVTCPMFETGDAENNTGRPYLAVIDPVNDVWHSVQGYFGFADGYCGINASKDRTYSTRSNGTGLTEKRVYSSMPVLSISRVSGTLHFRSGIRESTLGISTTQATTDFWVTECGTVADADTYTIIEIGAEANLPANAVVAFSSLRRTI